MSIMEQDDPPRFQLKKRTRSLQDAYQVFQLGDNVTHHENQWLGSNLRF